MSRQQRALRPPPDALDDFPRWSLTSRRILYRAHTRGLSPWWFASDLSGRFDLPSPHGTCYLAASPAVAVRERWGAKLVDLGFVMDTQASSTVVSALRVPHTHRLADATSARAALFGATRELSTGVPYELAHRWAEAFHRDGFAGVRYEARFSTGRQDLSFAIFGPAGRQMWDEPDRPTPGADAARAAGIRVLPTPRRINRVIRPPGLD